MNWRIDVAEVPLVRGDLSVWVKINLLRQEAQLLLGKIDIYARENHAVKCEIPGREPGIFPFVRHRQDIGAFEMEPPLVARRGAACAIWRKDSVTQPLRYRIVIELFAPQHSGEGLAHNEILGWMHGWRSGC